jgi:hypothetical protein
MPANAIVPANAAPNPIITMMGKMVSVEGVTIEVTVNVIVSIEPDVTVVGVMTVVVTRKYIVSGMLVVVVVVVVAVGCVYVVSVVVLAVVVNVVSVLVITG